MPVCSEIRSRYNQKQVLTVSFPTDLETKGESQPQPLAGCAITLQSRRVNLFGHAHQRWSYDAETGFISAFSTDLPDKGEGWLVLSQMFKRTVTHALGQMSSCMKWLAHWITACV